MSKSTTSLLLADLNKWLSRTSFHGLNKINSNTSKPVTIIWLLFFTVMFIICVFNVRISVSLFFSHKTETSMKYVQKTRLTFPTITLCNLEIYNSFSDRFVIRDQLREHKTNQNLNDKTNEFELDKFYKVNENFYQTTPFLSNLTDQQIKELSYNISEMLVSCEFNTVSCGVDDFTEIWNYHYGVCYQFNKNKSQISMNDGVKYGLHLELYVGMSDPSLSYTKSAGMRLFVHHPSLTPDFSKEGIFISTNAITDVKIYQTNVNLLSEPYSNCIQNVTSSSELVSVNAQMALKCWKTYTQRYCFLACLNDFVLEKCSTNISEYRIFGESSTNYTIEDLLCVEDASREFYHTEELTANCLNKCPKMCSRVEYESIASQSVYPTLGYSQFMKEFFKNRNGSKFFNCTDYKNSMLAVNLYYPDIGYKTIDEYPVKTFLQIFSDTGGILGLCAGASFLSLIEIVDLVIGLVWRLIKREKADVNEGLSEIEMMGAKLKEQEIESLRLNEKIESMREMLFRLSMAYERRANRAASQT